MARYEKVEVMDGGGTFVTVFGGAGRWYVDLGSPVLFLPVVGTNVLQTPLLLNEPVAALMSAS